jgi:DNA-nicking Smr family endonuclease
MDFERILKKYPPKGADRREKEAVESPETRDAGPAAAAGAAWRKLPIEASLDIHGMRAEEAERELRAFIDGSYREGKQKLLIVHGKGLHSRGGEPVLKTLVRRVLAEHPLAGRTETPGRELGGSGATIVRVRKLSVRGK